MTKYYFLTYQGTSTVDLTYTYNDVSEGSIIKFYQELHQSESRKGWEWIILFAIEITKEEFEEFNKGDE